MTHRSKDIYGFNQFWDLLLPEKRQNRVSSFIAKNYKEDEMITPNLLGKLCPTFFP